METRATRQDRKNLYEDILVEHLAAERRAARSKSRQLDGEFWGEDWLLAS